MKSPYRRTIRPNDNADGESGSGTLTFASVVARRGLVVDRSPCPSDREKRCPSIVWMVQICTSSSGYVNVLHVREVWTS